MSTGRVHAAVGVYTASAGVALVWRAAQGQSALHDGVPLGTTHAIAIPLGLSIGALVGVSVVWATQIAATRTVWGRGLHAALREAVYDIPRDSLGVLALSAAVGEELFFRGALLPTLAGAIGTALAVVVSSVAFGLLHVPWNRRLIPWTLTAVGMGVVFASLYLVTGEVLAPIAAHAVINRENLHFLLTHDPQSARRV